MEWVDRADTIGIGGGDTATGEEGCADHVGWEHAEHVGSAAHGAAVDFGEGEIGVVRGDDRVRGAGDVDAAADNEAVQSGNDRNWAGADGVGGAVVVAVELDDTFRVGLHFLYVDPAAEAAAFGADENAMNGWVVAGFVQEIRDYGPEFRVERVYRWGGEE